MHAIDEKLHPLPDLAEEFGVSDSLLRREIKNGTLRSVRLFGRVLVPESARREFLATHLRPNDGPRRRQPVPA